MNSVDAILYINLEHRKDRLKNIKYQLFDGTIAKSLPIDASKIIRIDAFYDKVHGAVGCATSHIKALDLAIENGWETIAIFEDDFVWKPQHKYIINSLRQIDELKIPWDVLLLATNTKVLRKKDIDVPNLQKVWNAQTACGYLVHGVEYIKKLRDCFAVAHSRLKKGLPRKQNAIDIYWKKFQLIDNWYSFKETLGKQCISYSDILKRNVNYENQM